MKSTNSDERVKRNSIMDVFCADRNMQYEPVNIMDQIDAVLWFDKTGKRVGIAKIFKQQGNYGFKAVIEIDKEALDFLHEMAMLCALKPAIIIKFRDTMEYLRLDDLIKYPLINNMKKGKSFTEYQIPIGELKSL